MPLSGREEVVRSRRCDVAACRPKANEDRSQLGHRSAEGDRPQRRRSPSSETARRDRRHRRERSQHGSVVIAAITSCTNTSNPSVMIAAGLLAKKAVEKGLKRQAVGEDQPRAGLEGRHRLPARCRADTAARTSCGFQPRRLRLHDLHRQQRPAAATRSRSRSTEGDLVAAAVLSGNRNFEGRINRRRPRQLPGLAAAGRRLRPRRADRHRPAE